MKIIKAEELPRDESIYLKKDYFGYRIVHPIKNDDGTINWLNFLVGGKRNLVVLIIIMIVLGGILYSYAHDIKEMQDVVENPCDYCDPNIKIQPLLKNSIAQNVYG